MRMMAIMMILVMMTILIMMIVMMAWNAELLQGQITTPTFDGASMEMDSTQSVPTLFSDM
jgi:hypothetical protein